MRSICTFVINNVNVLHSFTDSYRCVLINNITSTCVLYFSNGKLVQFKTNIPDIYINIVNDNVIITWYLPFETEVSLFIGKCEGHTFYDIKSSFVHNVPQSVIDIIDSIGITNIE